MSEEAEMNIFYCTGAILRGGKAVEVSGITSSCCTYISPDRYFEISIDKVGGEEKLRTKSRKNQYLRDHSDGEVDFNKRPDGEVGISTEELARLASGEVDIKPDGVFRYGLGEDEKIKKGQGLLLNFFQKALELRKQEGQAKEAADAGLEQRSAGMTAVLPCVGAEISDEEVMRAARGDTWSISNALSERKHF
ncbi:MAG: hypothetical protein GY804_04830 [Alphaproteobacteria bacterium]|nr:hypothetical protein [Alphaproteobacteria bacterium]